MFWRKYCLLFRKYSGKNIMLLSIFFKRGFIIKINCACGENFRAWKLKNTKVFFQTLTFVLVLVLCEYWTEEDTEACRVVMTNAIAWHIPHCSLRRSTALVTTTTDPHTWLLRAAWNRRSAKRTEPPGLVHCRGCGEPVRLTPRCTPQIDYSVRPAPDLK